MKYLECVGAYGRDYPNGKEVQKAWDEGKDFTIVTMGPDNGRQINKADAEKEKGLTLNIRYKNLTQIKVIRIK